MELESKITPTFDQEKSEERASPSQIEQIPRIELNQIKDSAPIKDTAPRRAETRVDQAFAAIVCGLTASFVTFVFGLVTEYIQRTIDNLLLSIFVGVCISVIAYALMTSEDR